VWALIPNQGAQRPALLTFLLHLVLSTVPTGKIEHVCIAFDTDAKIAVPSNVHKIVNSFHLECSMMEHARNRSESAYNKITTSKKSIEIRLFDEKRQKLNVGDIIEFSKLSNLEDKVKVEIVALLRYKSFRGLVHDFGMEYYGYPKDYPVDEFVKSFYSIYSKEEEKEFGVLGIKLKLLDDV
jgi:ASC-1-like (ASCH) protein